MMLARIHRLASALLILAASAGSGSAAEPVKVVATFSILGDLVQSVGGELVTVTTLVGANGDTHVYQPTPADAKALAAAGLVVENGLNMEGWIDRLIQASGYRGKVVVASAGVEMRTMAAEEEVATAGKSAPASPRAITDPHAWQDLRNGQTYVRNIAKGLAAADPAHTDAYRANAEAYNQELATLDTWVRQEMDCVPTAKRRVITTHDAFGYFGAAYGVQFIAPEGISTESEPSAAGVARLIRQIKREHIKALFIENMTDPRLIKQIARETGARVGGEIYSDALSERGGPADTYIKMFRHNVPALKAAMLEN